MVCSGVLYFQVPKIMNCYDCGEALGEDEITYLGTGGGAQPFCATCADMREWEKPNPLESSDISDDDIFDHYRFPT